MGSGIELGELNGALVWWYSGMQGNRMVGRVIGGVMQSPIGFDRMELHLLVKVHGYTKAGPMHGPEWYRTLASDKYGADVNAVPLGKAHLIDEVNGE